MVWAWSVVCYVNKRINVGHLKGNASKYQKMEKERKAKRKRKNAAAGPPVCSVVRI